MEKIRIDQLVFELGYAESREKAKTTVMSGIVFVDGKRVDKPGTQVKRDASVEVHGQTMPFVSRGGYKLDKALKVFPIDPSGRLCIDCGASTGGFTDVLLQHDAAKVYSVDVGYGQLAWKLRNDPRVINLERVNLRYVTEEQIPERLSLAVCDVSFISLKLVLPSVIRLLEEDADIVCLIKPQFEAGKDDVGKKGVVRDKKIHVRVIQDILQFAKEQGLTLKGIDYSPIKGPEGNIEFITYLKNGKGEEYCPDIEQLVEMAHQNL